MFYQFDWRRGKASKTKERCNKTGNERGSKGKIKGQNTTPDTSCPPQAVLPVPSEQRKSAVLDQLKIQTNSKGKKELTISPLPTDPGV